MEHTHHTTQDSGNGFTHDDLREIAREVDVALSPTVELVNLANAASDMIYALQKGGQQDAIEAAAQGLWHGGMELIQSQYNDVQRIGYALALMAALRAPESFTAAARCLAARLLKSVDFASHGTDDAAFWADVLPGAAALYQDQQEGSHAT